MKSRNCHLAMHLAGNRGAGQHESNYYELKHQHIPDVGEMNDDELQEHILAAIKERERRGIARHYSVNFIPVARHSDIVYCLEQLVESQRLRVSREYKCSTCGNIVASRELGAARCCARPLYRMLSEFFFL